MSNCQHLVVGLGWVAAEHMRPNLCHSKSLSVWYVLYSFQQNFFLLQSPCRIL